MAFIKNPFAKKEGVDQTTPDLMTPDKAKKTAKEIQEGLEISKEKAKEIVDKTKEKIKPIEKDVLQATPPAQAKTPVPAHVKSVTLQKVENILQEDLEEIYFNMDEAHRRLFKEEGEKAAFQIEKVLATGKSVAVKILEIIKKWLRFIPGVNKFFIEQEAKIKTDKILKINSKH